MLTFYDSQNQPQVLGERLGSGGEGTVYVCESAGLVAKIYREPVTAEKAEKLRWMAAHKNEPLLKVAAWVVDVLHDAPGGKVVGFLMPNIRAKEIHELYSLKSRRVYFPEATWYFLIHTAANLARGFYNLHKNAHIMGDVNHGNCVVLADGTVKLIDCDSYSIQTDKMRYSCDVGVATHLAPELHGVELSRAARQFKHDNFGLAVLIFQLLFLGRHPFAGNYLGAVDKSIEDCIREHRFAYGSNAKLKNVKQPPGTLSLSAVSPRLALMFERAFLTEDRPEPREWIEALEDLSANLEQCREHPGHVFYKELPHCPWCEIEAQTGVMLFPFVMSGIGSGHDGKHFDIATIENLIASFHVTESLQEKLADFIPRQAKYRHPSPRLVEQHIKQRNQQLIIIALFSIIYFPLTLISIPFAFLIALIGLAVIHSNFGNPGMMLRSDAHDDLKKAQLKWRGVEDDWAKLLVTADLNENVRQIKERLADYAALKGAADETAPVKLAENHPLSIQQVKHRETLEKEISRLLNALRTGSLHTSKYLRQIQAQTKPLAEELAQLQSNVKYLGTNLPLIVILGLITVGMPIISSTFLSSSKSNVAPRPIANTTAANYPANRLATAPGIGTPPPKMNVFIPEENITDREIDKMLASERHDIAVALVQQATFALDANDLVLGEKKLNFARRFDDKNWLLFSKLGILYYNQAKYPQSVTALKQSLALMEGEDAEFYLGMNYLQLRKYSEARSVFLKLTTGGMQNYASFYNLGMAQQGLEDYPAAVTAYQKSLNFEPNDLDATYRMGICFSKMKDREQVERFYIAIREKDKTRAARFKNEVGKSFNLDSVASGNANQNLPANVY